MNSEKTLRKTQGLLEEAEDALADQKKRKKEIECRLKEIQESMQVESHTFDEEVDELVGFVLACWGLDIIRSIMCFCR